MKIQANVPNSSHTGLLLSKLQYSHDSLSTIHIPSVQPLLSFCTCLSFGTVEYTSTWYSSSVLGRVGLQEGCSLWPSKMDREFFLSSQLLFVSTPVVDTLWPSFARGAVVKFGFEREKRFVLSWLNLTIADVVIWWDLRTDGIEALSKEIFHFVAVK